MSNTVSQPELFYCDTIPLKPEPEILRDGILSTLEDILTGPAEILFLDGAEGSGKTTVLAQFVRSRPTRCFALFIRNVSRWTYDPQILEKDLSNQILWRLDGQEIKDDAPSRATLADCIFRLRRHARKTNRPYYFIVDGLARLTSSEQDARNDILKLLPFGIPGFKFLLTGSHPQYPDISQSAQTKTFFLPNFTLDEARRFFTPISLPTEEYDRLYKLCRGNPSKMEAVRRLLLQASDPKDLVCSLPEHLPSIFDMDWEPVAGLSDQEINTLSILTYAKTTHSIDTLSAVSGLPADQLLVLVNKLPFLEINPNDGLLLFRSEGHRDYANKKLQSHKEFALDSTIHYLLDNKNSREALLTLPSCLDERRRFDDLLSFLSPEHIHRIVKFTHSWVVAQRHTHLGVTVATKLGRYAEALGLSTQEAALRQLDDAQSWRAEVEASVAVGDFVRARGLADSLLSNEDRLHLLAVIERRRKEQGGTIDDDVIAETKRLFETIDITAMGEKALSIAVDLLYVNPDLAIQLLKSGTKDVKRDKNRDQELAQFTMEAFDMTRKSGNADSFSKLLLQLDEPSASRFSSTVPLLFGDFKAAEVIFEVQKLTSIDARVAMLCIWCRQHAKHEDASKVVSFALDQILQSTEYTPTARVFREIAQPLLYSSNTYITLELVTRLTSQRSNAARVGPTEEYVRFEITLACAELRYDEETGCSRIVEMYLLISECEDTGVKAACLSRALSLFAQFDTNNITIKNGIVADFELDLTTCISSLLSQTARHFQTVRHVLRALAHSSWRKAAILANSLNTEERRDRAKREIAFCAFTDTMPHQEIRDLLACCDTIILPQYRNASLMRLVEHIVRCKEDLSAASFPPYELIEIIKRVDDPSERCRGFALVLAKINRSSPAPSSVSDTIEMLIDSSWQSIDVDWRRIDTGFHIVVSLAEHSIEKAKIFLERIHKLRKETKFSVRSTGLGFIDGIRLCIQCFGGLCHSSEDLKDEEQALLSLISKLSSGGLRAQLIADLALMYNAAHRDTSCKNIVSQHLRPLLNQLNISDGRFRAHVISYTAPAMFCGHAALAIDIINSLPEVDREGAFRRIIWYLFTHVRPIDPYEDTAFHTFQVGYETLRDIVEVAKNLTRDYYIYDITQKCVNSLCSDNNKTSISFQQRDEMARLLSELLINKLPSRTGVPHDGYLIISNAFLYKLQNKDKVSWEDLIEKGRKLNNTADISYVLGVCGMLLPTKWQQLKDKTLQDARQAALSIPTLLDKIEHLELLADQNAIDSPRFAKDCIQTALREGISTNDEGVQDCHKKLIDMAYRIDSDFAVGLASLCDSDPSKTQAKTAINERLDWNRLREKMADSVVDESESKESNAELIDIIDILHGQLNAKKIAPKRLEDLKEYIGSAANLPIKKSYSYISWVVANVVSKYSKTNNCVKTLSPIFQALLSGAGLAERVASDLNSSSVEFVTTQPRQGGPSLLVKDGDRDKALDYMRRWMETEIGTRLRILDPYFGPADLECILSIRSVSPTCSIEIVTSGKHNREHCNNEAFETFYRRFWNVSVAEQDPGDCTICIVGTKSAGIAPFHDRYWLSDNGGLRIGTSLTSLGKGKTSEISPVAASDASILNDELTKYLRREVRMHRDQKLEYSIFSL